MGKDKATGVVRVRIDTKFYRPTEVVSFNFNNFIGRESSECVLTRGNSTRGVFLK